VNYYQPNDRFSGYIVKTKGKGAIGSVSPNNKGEIKLNLPADHRNYDALVLVATDPFNKEIYKWIWKLRSNKEMLQSFMVMNDSATHVVETDSSYTLKGGEVTMMLNKRTGLLMSVKNSSSDNLSFNNGPVLVQGNTKLVSSKQYQDGKNNVVEFSYDGNLKYARWTMYGSGWVSLDYAYSLNGNYPFSGISFQYPENFILSAKWLGKGPYRQWKNRMDGMEINVWQNRYNNTQTGYAPLIYPEFKGYYGDVSWMEFNTVEGKFYTASEDPGLFVRLFDFYALTGVKPHPELPIGNISFLDAIPPIGSKLALNINYNTSALGPQSEPNKINETIKRRLYFYFGTPKNIIGKELYSRPEIDSVF
jgi:hypothetical protein